MKTVLTILCTLAFGILVFLCIPPTLPAFAEEPEVNDELVSGFYAQTTRISGCTWIVFTTTHSGSDGSKGIDAEHSWTCSNKNHTNQ